MVKKKRAQLPFIDSRSLTMDEWLRLVLTPLEKRNYYIDDSHFPREEYRDEYIGGISARTDIEVRELLRLFLIKGGSLGCDREIALSLMALGTTEMGLRMESSEYLRRVILQKPWDGMHWILDLLPRYPREALQAISAYCFAYNEYLPDGRALGLSDAEELIRAKYLEAAHDANTLLELSPRDFELLICECFDRLGYKSEVGSGGRDGGVDVSAKKLRPSGLETVLIQCKLYKDPVGVEAVRQLFGVVEARRATRGVLVTSSRFTSDAEQFGLVAARMELIDFTKLDRLLNSAFGARWPSSIGSHISSRRRRMALACNTEPS